MRILIHSLVFSPDGVSTAFLYRDIAKGLQKNGLEVVVLTTTPHYNDDNLEFEKQVLKKKLFGLFFTSSLNGIIVYHLPFIKYRNTFFRILSFIYLHLFSFLFSFFIGKIDVILSPSPPLSIGFVSILIAKFKGSKTIYNIQELYPDLLIQKGIFNNKLVILGLRKLESFIYNNSSSIIVIGEEFYYKIKERIIDFSKVSIISNFVDTDQFKPISGNIDLPFPFPSLSNKFILLYAGNIGFYQDWEATLFAANALKDRNIEFWIVGEGVRKPYLSKQITKENLKNIKLFPYQNRDVMNKILNRSDVHFIPISPKLEDQGFPSKIFTSMACSKPVIVLAGKTSPLYNFLKDKDCALLIADDRNNNFLSAIELLINSKSLRIDLGRKGLEYVQNELSSDMIVEKYYQQIIKCKND
jgi:glycosyltransferase involved in cell wall biosynthesis